MKIHTNSNNTCPKSQPNQEHKLKEFMYSLVGPPEPSPLNLHHLKPILIKCHHPRRGWVHLKMSLGTIKTETKLSNDST